MRVPVRSQMVWAAICLGASAAGCGGGQHVATGGSTHVKVQAIQPAASPRDGVSVLLEDLAAYSSESAEAELPVALERFAWSGSREDRLWVGLLTLRARADEARDAQALALLEVASENPPGEGADLASVETLVRTLLASRIDAERTATRSDRQLAAALEQVAHLGARLKESQKKTEALNARLHGERKKAEELATRLSQQEKKTTALQNQIDQLKSIERIIDTRTEPQTTEAEK